MTLQTPSEQRQGGAPAHHARTSRRSGAHHLAPTRRSRRAASRSAARERARWLLVGALALAAPFAAALAVLATVG